MNESARPRFAVDLDEIEKQLGRQGQAAPATPTRNDPLRNDPLAELARIVGQDDPFQTLLAGDRSGRPGSEPSVEDLFVARDGGRTAAPGLRSTYEPRDELQIDFRGDVAASYAEYHAKVESDGNYDPNFTQSFHEGAPGPYGEGGGPELSRRKSRKILVAGGAVVAMVVLGLGGALMLKSPATTVAGEEPPLIKATNEPSKVHPQTPGGVEIPNQNKQIYERAGQETQTKVVNREEQPVDVRQATRAAAQAEGAGIAPIRAASAIPPAGHGLNLGEPRKVRTVSVRPDGTIISPDSPPPPPRSTTPAQAPAALALPPAARADQPGPAPSATPPQSRPTATVAAPATPAPRLVPAPPAGPASPGGSSPQQAASPASPPASAPQPAAPQQRTAAVQPSAPAPAAAPAAADAAPVGGFSVQLGVSPSEAEARTTLQRLKQKFPDLDGTAPLIRKAEVNGNTIFRVRVGPMSRDDASSLCSKVQGQGGDCFVARN